MDGWRDEEAFVVTANGSWRYLRVCYAMQCSYRRRRLLAGWRPAPAISAARGLALRRFRGREKKALGRNWQKNNMRSQKSINWWPDTHLQPGGHSLNETEEILFTQLITVNFLFAAIRLQVQISYFAVRKGRQQKVCQYLRVLRATFCARAVVCICAHLIRRGAVRSTNTYLSFCHPRRAAAENIGSRHNKVTRDGWHVARKCNHVRNESVLVIFRMQKRERADRIMHAIRTLVTGWLVVPVFRPTDTSINGTDLQGSRVGQQ